jgi:transcriptional regulator with XRE-family HTH domain
MARPEYATHVEPYLKQIPTWYKTMSVRQIAAKLGVSKTTLYKYAKDYPELAAALEGSKAELVDDLKNSIKKRALGYTWTEVTQEKALSEETGELVVIKEKRVTKHVPADLGSAHLLLKNLDPTWHDADQITIRQREKDLDIKQQKADAAEW